MKEVLIHTHGYSIPLGRRGENKARQITFDMTPFIETYGEGTAQIIHQRKKDGTPYIPEIFHMEDENLIWILTGDDTAFTGTGKAEIRWYVGDTLAKSVIFATQVFPSLTDPGEPEPEDVKTALDLLAEKVEKVGVPSGGAEGEVLTKRSNDDNDVEWRRITIPVKVSELENDAGYVTELEVEAIVRRIAPGESEIPAAASINSTGLITYSNSGGEPLFTLQLPIYNGEVV